MADMTQALITVTIVDSSQSPERQFNSLFTLGCNSFRQLCI